jgi:hypothetical protein
MKPSFNLLTDAGDVNDGESRTQRRIASMSAEILIVAKLEKVSDTAYGKMIWSLCLIAPQV